MRARRSVLPRVPGLQLRHTVAPGVHHLPAVEEHQEGDGDGAAGQSGLHHRVEGGGQGGGVGSELRSDQYQTRFYPMATVGSYEAKTHLPALLKRVEAGESITITRHGHPIARIVPVTRLEAMGPAAAVDALLAFRKGRTLGPELTARKLVEAGRR